MRDVNGRLPRAYIDGPPRVIANSSRRRFPALDAEDGFARVRPLASGLLRLVVAGFRERHALAQCRSRPADVADGERADRGAGPRDAVGLFPGSVGVGRPHLVGCRTCPLARLVGHPRDGTDRNGRRDDRDVVTDTDSAVGSSEARDGFFDYSLSSEARVLCVSPEQFRPLCGAERLDGASESRAAAQTILPRLFSRASAVVSISLSKFSSKYSSRSGCGLSP